MTSLQTKPRCWLQIQNSGEALGDRKEDGVDEETEVRVFKFPSPEPSHLGTCSCQETVCCAYSLKHLANIHHLIIMTTSTGIPNFVCTSMEENSEEMSRMQVETHWSPYLKKLHPQAHSIPGPLWLREAKQAHRICLPQMRQLKEETRTGDDRGLCIAPSSLLTCNVCPRQKLMVFKDLCGALGCRRNWWRLSREGTVTVWLCHKSGRTECLCYVLGRIRPVFLTVEWGFPCWTKKHKHI